MPKHLSCNKPTFDKNNLKSYLKLKEQRVENVIENETLLIVVMLIKNMNSLKYYLISSRTFLIHFYLLFLKS